MSQLFEMGTSKIGTDYDDEIDDGKYPHAQPNPWRVQYPPYNPQEWELLPDCGATIDVEAEVEAETDLRIVQSLAEVVRTKKRPYDADKEYEEMIDVIRTASITSVELGTTKGELETQRPRKRMRRQSPPEKPDRLDNPTGRPLADYNSPKTPVKPQLYTETSLPTPPASAPKPLFSSPFQHTIDQSYRPLEDDTRKTCRHDSHSYLCDKSAGIPTKHANTLVARRRRLIAGQATCFNPLSFFDDFRSTASEQEARTDCMDLSA